jgi:hypothetical protein
MGMFDDVVCKYSLPMPEDPKGYSGVVNFQTKDLENALSLFEIREDGTIWKQYHNWEFVPGDPLSKKLLERTGRARSVHKWYVQEKITRDVEIYSYQVSNETDNDYWISYQIKFIDGIIVEVKLLQFESTNNQKRKDRDNEFEEKLRKRSEFEKNFFYKYLGQYYNVIIDFICGSIYTITSWLNHNIWKIKKFLKF